MPGFTCVFHKLELKYGDFVKTLDKDIRTQIRQAARAFFRVATESVPVRTGFARGAFSNILEAMGGGGESRLTPAQSFLRGLQVVRQSRFARPRQRRSTVQIPQEYYYGGGRKILKTPESGRQFATPAASIFQVRNWEYTFHFDVVITYFDIQDVRKHNSPTSPWKAFERGKAAFLDYINTEAVRKLPKVENFITTTELRVNG